MVSHADQVDEMAESIELESPLQATVLAVRVAAGMDVDPGALLVILESMKMEHPVAAPERGVVAEVSVAVGDVVAPGDLLVRLEPAPPTSVVRDDEQVPAPVSEALSGEAADADGSGNGPEGATSAEAASSGESVPSMTPPDEVATPVRADLEEVRERHALGSDRRRPDAVEARRRRGRSTVRENIGRLVDDGTFVEYGPLVVAAQRRRRDLDDLIRNTPADGLVAGIGEVNGLEVGAAAARTMIVAYDYTVLAGTQGAQNHRKKDRVFQLAAEMELPVVLFSEGGGGRPGDTDALGVAGLDTEAFARFARLSGRVPLIGINTGYCFAGNAALLGTCDVVIATADSNIAMAGPAMVEGGGLGTFHPTELGPAPVQVATGLVDRLVDDDAAAVDLARRILGVFQGPIREWAAPEPAALRELVPERRVEVHDMRRIVEGLCDVGSVEELRPDQAPGMITAFGRVEGRPLGVIANNPLHLGGAIDAEGARSSARMMRLCDTHGLPILFLCDTPGFMVGPDAEADGMVVAAGDLFRAGASLRVAHGTVITRKGYGLGAQAMAGGHFKAGRFTVAWPTGEIGGMGLEGAVTLGFRKELEAIADPAERETRFEEMVALAYEHGRALSAASHFEFDDVIDPADTRRWITTSLFD